MQVEQQAVQSLPGVIEAAAKSPLGVMALMAILIAAIAYTFFKEASSALKSIIFLVLFAGVVGFGFSVSKSLGSAASGGIQSKPSVPASSSNPAPPTATPAESKVEKPLPEPRSDAPGGRTGAGPKSEAVVTRWEPDGEVFDEKTTSDHHCSSNCQGEPTRTNYRISIDVDASHRLSSPRLVCAAGACEWSSNNFARIAADGRRVEGSFDVWGRPTRWRLAATQEKLVTK